ncbi:hypothetical protein ACHAXA_004719 [Cyclostephanos tholiformis]|uniref:PDZ domain-containing protein n=1 Tax=Cyclostephanos tholiformis TaxID=382380 RepID=A0ABD3SRK3_9STRA
MTAAATSSNPSSSSSLLESMRCELLSLNTQKKSLLSEAEAIVSELTAKQPGGGPPIGIDDPLVDAEGYPRADIDIYRARTLRRRFKEIQTDHKALEKRIELGLVEIAALSRVDAENSSAVGNSGSVGVTTTKEDEEELRLRLAPKPKPKFDPKTGKWVVKSWDGSVAGVEDGESRCFDDLNVPSTAALASNLAGGAADRPDVGGGIGAATAEENSSSDESQRQHRGGGAVSFLENAPIPFAIIDEVSLDSPASEAGIQVNDVLLRFGDVDSTNHRDFRAIAELLPFASSENRSISVIVRRGSAALGGSTEITVTLRPRPWGGRGLLGCHIRPYNE